MTSVAYWHELSKTLRSGASRWENASSVMERGISLTHFEGLFWPIAPARNRRPRLGYDFRDTLATIMLAIYP